MSYPDIPPLELLNQLAPDVKEYFLDKVNRYYRKQADEEIKEERKREVENFLRSTEDRTFTDAEGKTVIIRHAMPEDIKALKNYLKETKQC